MGLNVRCGFHDGDHKDYLLRCDAVTLLQW
jgi:hypothetical protein